MIGALFAKADHPAAQLGILGERQRQREITLSLQLGDGLAAEGAARIAGGEHRLAGDGRARPEAQVAGRRHRLAVLVEAQEGAVEVVAGEVEVVRIAAEEGRPVARREHQPQVGVAAVFVQLVLAALVELDHLAFEFPIVAADRLGDAGGGGVARLDQRFATEPGAGRGHARRGVDDLQQHVALQAGAGALIGEGCREEAGLGEVVAGRAEGLQAVGDAVVVGQHQAAGADLRGRAAHREPHRRALHPIQPRGRDVDAVGRLDLRRRDVVEGPQTLVRVGRRRGEQRRRAGGRKRRDLHSDRLPDSACRDLAWNGGPSPRRPRRRRSESQRAVR
jgi:hypothetical protein